jgi:hypothetical protein
LYKPGLVTDKTFFGDKNLIERGERQARCFLFLCPQKNDSLKKLKPPAKVVALTKNWNTFKSSVLKQNLKDLNLILLARAIGLVEMGWVN